jgi:two-component system nitrate/nitrite response regulator NarL
MSIQNLTPREREIVASLCEGNSNKMIARALGISEGTVKVHLNNIYTKWPAPGSEDTELGV